MNTVIAKISSPDYYSKSLPEAAEIIKNGGLVAFPTETVYGLGANALDTDAVAKIFEAKGRPQDNPLIVHIAFPDEIKKYAYTSSYTGCEERLNSLVKRFMPGPLTVILPKKDIVPDIVTAGMRSVAIRCPSNKTANELIIASGVSIAAPSANLSGKPSPTRAEHVFTDMNGKIPMIIDGGDTDIGLESTVISLLAGKTKLLRPGGVTFEELKELCPDIEADPAVRGKLPDGQRPLAPGMKYRHYAPKAQIIAVKGREEKILSYFKEKLLNGAGILCYDEDKLILPSSENAISFGAKNDKNAQAAQLFERLREFDLKPVSVIYTRYPDDTGLGLAVFNRLLKACGFDTVNADLL